MSGADSRLRQRLASGVSINIRPIFQASLLCPISDLQPNRPATDLHTSATSKIKREATIVHEREVADLVELDRAWAKLATLPAHAQWGKELEPLVVSGSSRWKVCWVIEPT
ncbi:MAG: hypothetical protein ACXWIN_00710 [Burkholderiaceae bacterium]